MKKFNQLFFVFCFLFSLNIDAQSFELLDANNVSIDGTTHYVYGTNIELDHVKFNINNLSNSTQTFALKVRQEYSPYPQSGLSICFLTFCFHASTGLFSTQIINNGVGDTIPANSQYNTNLDMRPVTWPWIDCPNDSSIWHITIYDPGNIADSSSARVIYKCVTSTNIGESLNEASFNIYPNPTNSVLNFNSIITGRLYSVLGNEVLRFNNKSEIDISHLTKGVYFLKTNGSTIRILKQ